MSMNICSVLRIHLLNFQAITLRKSMRMIRVPDRQHVSIQSTVALLS
jgi:hypothetical protein